jgi:hypothetical protein
MVETTTKENRHREVLKVHTDHCSLCVVYNDVCVCVSADVDKGGGV